MALAVYEFGKEDKDNSDAEDRGVTGEPNQDEPDAKVDDEDEVAQMLMDSNEGEESKTQDDDMHSEDDAQTDSNPDQDAMNLLQDIRQLEATLSNDRVKQSKTMLMMLATGADVTEIFSPARVAGPQRNLG